MGQPDQGQGGGTGGWVPAPGGTPPTGPPGQWPAPKRSRTGFWLVLACVLVVLLLGFLAITGGVVYLVARGGGGGDDTTTSAPAPVTFEHEYFTFSYPADWFSIDLPANAGDSGEVVQVADEDIDPEDYEAFAADSVVVYVYDSDVHAKVSCQMQAVWTGFGGDSSEDPEELDPMTIDGKQLPRHRTVGTHEGKDVVGETYCADAGSQVVQIVAETHGATELSPEVRAIFDSWTWTAG